MKSSMDAPSKSLFSSTETELVAYIDGASRGNPGPASYGVVVRDASGTTIKTISHFLGRATNNVAEWRALIAALEYALSRPTRGLKIYCDSELVARQMQGRYRVQSPGLKPLFEQARTLASQIGHFSIHNVPREQNREADRLANEALDNVFRGKASGRPVSPAADSVAAAQNTGTQTFSAIVEAGRLRPLPPLPNLEEGAEYEVRASKRYSDPVQEP